MLTVNIALREGGHGNKAPDRLVLFFFSPPFSLASFSSNSISVSERRRSQGQCASPDKDRQSDIDTDGRIK